MSYLILIITRFLLDEQKPRGLLAFLGEGIPELFLPKGTDYPHVAG